MTDSGPPRTQTAFPAIDPATGAERHGVALLTINRPHVLNALDGATLHELGAAIRAFESDPTCRSIVITGAGDRAFAAGGDVAAMVDSTPTSILRKDHASAWKTIRTSRVPLVAAVRGLALGGGCELALMCDLIIAGDDAVFGQPELRLGVIPGAGGTQRIPRTIGRAKAMDLILVGGTMSATEADARGLVSRVVPAATTISVALEIAATIAARPALAVRLARDAINHAFELPLEAGLEYERMAFMLAFDSPDQREGMQAFLEKREPRWSSD